MAKAKKEEFNPKGKSWSELAAEELSFAKKAREFNPHLDYNWASAGLPSFCLDMKTQGLPQGITEITGASGTGKTTLCVQLMKNFIDQQGKDNVFPVYFSGEDRAPQEISEFLGMNLQEDTTIINHTTIEDSQNKFYEVLELYKKYRVHNPDLVLFFIYDSLGQTFSQSDFAKYEKNAESGEFVSASPGAQAKAIWALLRCVKVASQQYPLHFLAINRTRDKIGFGQRGRQSAGGEAVTFLPKVRLDLIKTGTITDTQNNVLGHDVKVKIVKTDFRALGEFELRFSAGNGYIISEDDVDMAVKLGILEKNGHGYKTTDKVDYEFKWSSKKDLHGKKLHFDEGYKALMSDLLQRAKILVMEQRGLV